MIENFCLLGNWEVLYALKPPIFTTFGICVNHKGACCWVSTFLAGDLMRKLFVFFIESRGERMPKINATMWITVSCLLRYVVLNLPVNWSTKSLYLVHLSFNAYIYQNFVFTGIVFATGKNIRVAVPFVLECFWLKPSASKVNI